jgi:hypothetical protein
MLSIAPPKHSPVSALAWSPGGAFMAIGTESGYAAILDFSRKRG